jgi:hypothetical protein
MRFVFQNASEKDIKERFKLYLHYLLTLGMKQFDSSVGHVVTDTRKLLPNEEEPSGGSRENPAQRRAVEAKAAARHVGAVVAADSKSPNGARKTSITDESASPCRCEFRFVPASLGWARSS